VLQEMIVYCTWMTSFSSVHLVCFRGKKHEIASTSWSSCLGKLCKLVSNFEEQLCIVFMYTGNLYHLHDLAIWKWLKKCVHLKCICVWCLDNWFCQGKPFSTFSMARLKILQLHLTLTPLFTTTKDPTI
jgi:hypothetical protein